MPPHSSARAGSTAQEAAWGASAPPQPGAWAPTEPRAASAAASPPPPPPCGVLLPQLSLQQLRLHVAAAVAAGRGPALTAVRSTGFVQQLMLVDELATGLAAELERTASVQPQPQAQRQPLPAQLLAPQQQPSLASARRTPPPPSEAAYASSSVPPAAPPGADAPGADPALAFASLLARLTGQALPRGVKDEPAADAAAGAQSGGQAQLVMQLAELLQRHYEK